MLYFEGKEEEKQHLDWPHTLPEEDGLQIISQSIATLSTLPREVVALQLLKTMVH